MQEPMDIDFSSAVKDGMIMKVDKTERNYDNADFSSADEDEMVQELKRVEKRKYFCDLCDKVYMQISHLNRHKPNHKFYVQCSVCKRQYRRNDVCKRHMKSVHGLDKQLFPWKHCSNVYTTYSELFPHVVHNHLLSGQQQQQSSSSAEATAVAAPPPPLPTQSTSVANQPEKKRNICFKCFKQSCRSHQSRTTMFRTI